LPRHRPEVGPRARRCLHKLDLSPFFRGVHAVFNYAGADRLWSSDPAVTAQFGQPRNAPAQGRLRKWRPTRTRPGGCGRLPLPAWQLQAAGRDGAGAARRPDRAREPAGRRLAPAPMPDGRSGPGGRLRQSLPGLLEARLPAGVDPTARAWRRAASAPGWRPSGASRPRDLHSRSECPRAGHVERLPHDGRRARSLRPRPKKGISPIAAQRPGGCFAQIGLIPFSGRNRSFEATALTAGQPLAFRLPGSLGRDLACSP